MTADALTEPLESFWQRGLADLAQVPMEESVEEAPDQGGRDYASFRVSLRSVDDVRILGWYSIPRYRTGERRLRAVLATPGYDGIKMIPAHLVAADYAVLTLFPRGQGESVAEWDVEENTTKFTHGIEDPNTYYYRSAYLDCVRGMDFLSSRPEIDPQRIGMWGRSQGGTFGIVTAALDPRVSAVVAEEPFMSDFPTSIQEGQGAYEELRNYLAAHSAEADNVFRTLRYFDVLSHAAAVRCPTLVNLGQDDVECPASTIRKVFETMRCIKALVEYPGLGHEPCTDFNVHAMDWLLRYLG
jgi:cephalosporin-C deacetylase